MKWTICRFLLGLSMITGVQSIAVANDATNEKLSGKEREEDPDDNSNSEFELGTFAPVDCSSSVVREASGFPLVELNSTEDGRILGRVSEEARRSKQEDELDAHVAVALISQLEVAQEIAQCAPSDFKNKDEDANNGDLLCEFDIDQIVCDCYAPSCGDFAAECAATPGCEASGKGGATCTCNFDLP